MSIRNERVTIINFIQQGSDPQNIGELVYVNGYFKIKDSEGVLNLRTAGQGMTEDQHKTVRQLIHFIHGPAEGFSDAYHEETPVGPFSTLAVWYEDNTKAKKLFEHSVDQNPFPNIETFKIYKTDGINVSSKAVDTINYLNDGAFEENRTRVITIYA
jgi:hypothetical protein